MNCIVIPIYKEHISINEEISLLRCFEILKNHDIIFVSYNDINLNSYRNLLGQEIRIEYFDHKFFQDIQGYNKLLLSDFFYERFLKYDYILIYQLDCYVFSDQLDYWCSLNYDYIGAPWLFEEYFSLSFYQRLITHLKIKFNLPAPFTKLSRNDLYLKVGNGGFSLRKTKSFYKNLISENHSHDFCSDDSSSLYNEDVYWSLFAKGIRKPHYKQAVGFSLDPGASRGMVMHNNLLPFGCHAWHRNIDFWSQFIKDLR